MLIGPAVQERAQQWVTENMRPLQQQLAICAQQLAGRDSQLNEKGYENC